MFCCNCHIISCVSFLSSALLCILNIKTEVSGNRFLWVYSSFIVVIVSEVADNYTAFSLVFNESVIDTLFTISSTKDMILPFHLENLSKEYDQQIIQH